MKKIKLIWYRLSIKRKLMMLFSLIVFSLSLLNLYTLLNAFRYLEIYEQVLLSNTMIHSLQTAIAENNTTLEDYIMYSSQSMLDRYNSQIPEIWSRWNRIWKNVSPGTEAYFNIAAVRYGFMAYIENTKKVLELKKRDEPEFIQSLLYNRRINGYMEGYLKKLVQLSLEEGGRIHSAQVSKVRIIRTVSFLGVILISGLFLYLGTFFSDSVSKPVRELAERSLRMAEGDLSVSDYRVHAKDEIGVLTKAFNKMNTNIHDMVKKLEDKVEIEKKLREDELKIAEMNQSLKEAQFLSLQSQIDPHFLFNTLNTISRMSMFEKAPKTVKLIESLSNIFRYTLNKQSRLVSLAEEIEILEEYMHIQKIRYGERLKFRTEYFEGIKNTRIPIFTLQPLVENAIKYGIEPKEEGGTISLSVRQQDESVMIVIEDTGMGIPEERLAAISSGEETAEETMSTGIGINNVRRRIGIAFGNKSEFRIESIPGEGTRIYLKIPGDHNV